MKVTKITISHTGMFAAWMCLFTIGFAHLAGWDAVRSIFIWPYYLGRALAR